MAHRRGAHERGAWVRDAADAYAAKQQAARGRPGAGGGMSSRGWPLWEVFVRSRARALAHARRQPARTGRRDGPAQRTRRVHPPEEGVSIWVVPAGSITASSPDEKDAFFDPAGDKIYRHPTFYDVPDGVEHL